MDYVAGIDEVGRGPLAGPVVAAAVILDPNKPISGLNDSKKLSEKKRQLLAEEIHQNALAVSIAEASLMEIEQMNILHASLLAMQRACQQLAIRPSEVLVDGNQLPKVTEPCRAIIGGDKTVEAIMAASIIAKVYRDNLMIKASQQYPQYDFASHKGYGTAKHIQALKQFGPCPLHRKSFAPVAALLQTS